MSARRYVCSECGGLGHNKRTCEHAAVVPRSPRKRAIERTDAQLVDLVKREGFTRAARILGVSRQAVHQRHQAATARLAGVRS